MEKIICRVVSIVMVILAVIAMVGVVTVKGSGFLNLSNIARYVLIGVALVCGAVAVATAKASKIIKKRKNCFF